MKDLILKNIGLSEVLNIADLVSYQEGQIVSRTLVQNKAVSITLFAFGANEEISTHESKGDAFVYVLDGTANITIADDKFDVSVGQSIVMPANIPHSVEGKDPFKMMLVVVFPS